jgi:hypothetical protein
MEDNSSSKLPWMPTTRGATRREPRAMLPIQGPQDRSKRRVPARDEGIKPVKEMYATGDYCLVERVIVALNAAKGRYPLIIRNAIPPGALGPIATAWDDFVANDEEEYDTNEGPKTDSDKGSSCRGPQRLKRVWDEPWRVETNLKKQDEATTAMRARRSDHGNAVVKFLKSPKYKHATKGAHQLHQRIKRYASRATGGRCMVVEPSFVTGKIQKGVRNGDPCTTHQDTYDNYALILQGRKIFYTAKPPAFKDEIKWRGSGEPNERPKARPLDRTAGDKPSQWRKGDLKPGDMLYLPTDWWHAVLSDPHTVMTNIWTT